MKKNVVKMLMLAVVIGVLSVPASFSQPLAFPTAEGYGCYATGGRGGDVYHVTSLTDTLALGTLRYGIVNASGPRTIVFDISGTIALLSHLDVTNNNITIAGQTAPGDGICLNNFTLKINADDIIVRHLRFRPGSGALPFTASDGVSILNGNNVILDHCSLSWAVDENLGVGNSNIALSDMTIQWCIMSEGLCDPGNEGGDWNHSCGALFSPDNGKMSCVSMHHNLLAHNYKRNPYCAPYNDADIILDLRNNVIYNWGHKSIYAGAWNDPERDDVQMNLVGNYLIAGADTDDFYAMRAENTTIQGDIEFYRSGNYIDNDRDGNLDGNPWNSGDIYGNYTALGSPLSTPSVTTQTALQAYSLVLDQAGAGATVQSDAGRDSVDSRIADEVEGQNGGFIDQPSEVGGWPTLSSYTQRADYDQDGMSDFWENAFLLDPCNASDRNDDNDGDGYTNLEEYLSWLIGEGDGPLQLVNTTFEVDSAGAGTWTIDEGWQQSLGGEIDPVSGVAWQDINSANFADVDEAVAGEQVAFMNGSDVARLAFAGSGNNTGVFTTAAMMFQHEATNAGNYTFLEGRNGSDGTANAWKISWEVRLHNTDATTVELQAWAGDTLTTLTTGLAESTWYDVEIDADYDADTYDVSYRVYGSGTWFSVATGLAFVAEGAGHDDAGGGDAFWVFDGGCAGASGMFDNISVFPSLPFSLECGGWGYLVADIDKDCYVDLTDFAILAESWLDCTDPLGPDCINMQ